MAQAVFLFAEAWCSCGFACCGAVCLRFWAEGRFFALHRPARTWIGAYRKFLYGSAHEAVVLWYDWAYTEKFVCGAQGEFCYGQSVRKKFPSAQYLKVCGQNYRKSFLVPKTERHVGRASKKDM